MHYVSAHVCPLQTKHSRIYLHSLLDVKFCGDRLSVIISAVLSALENTRSNFTSINTHRYLHFLSPCHSLEFSTCMNAVCAIEEMAGCIKCTPVKYIQCIWYNMLSRSALL